MATLVGGSGDDTLVAQGGADFTIDGMGGNDVEIGGSGSDTFDSIGPSGADIMQGGDLSDTYFVDNVQDVVIEQSGEGTADAIFSSVDFGLFANVENLTLTGTAVVGRGNGDVNIITGNNSGDTLDGGANADTMKGGSGNDTYIVDNAGDFIIETDAPPVPPANNTEIDTVVSSINSFDLSDQLGTDSWLLHIENLTLTGAAISGRGNFLDNVLIGDAQANTLDASDGGNDTLDGGAGADFLIGGVGEDTFFVDNVNDQISAAAGGINTVELTVTWTMGPNEDNLILLGTSRINGTTGAAGGSITGNSAANILTGQGGDDILNGGGGADTMSGGGGNDIYFVDNSGDKVIEAAAAGTDTVIANATYTLGNNVENLTLGGSAAINGTGNSLANGIVGNSADNTLDGGTGADTMAGGAGNDVYIVDNGSDIVNEIAGQGTDTVVSSVDYDLNNAPNVENLVLTSGTAVFATGNGDDNIITGNAIGNIIDGGAGADTMIGGGGDDFYFVDNTGDVITEGVNAGTDTVFSTISYTLGADVENLILTGSVDKAGIGNSLANTIDGSLSSGNDTLDGGGGADTLIGGSGNDIYVIHDGTETIQVGTGTSTVESSVRSIDLNNANFAGIHTALLTGTTSLNLTGSGGDDVLTGNDGTNVLDGGGGTDTLDGGLGNDTFNVDTTTDVINDTGGVDTIVASVDYDLNLATGVENLTLSGGALVGTGDGSDNIIVGNGNVNTLVGGAGNDTLDGRAGADTMIGGTGDDTFYIDDANDVIVENPGEGTDTVIIKAGVNFTGSLANVEVVINESGTSGSQTGTPGADILVGGPRNDILNGGAGADTLSGGLGNDTYYVDNSGDMVIENPGAGTEKLFLTPDAVTFTSFDMRTSAANVENATILGTSNFDLMGNDDDNILTGNSGDNILNGWHGTDRMIGGAGNDIYIVNNIHDILSDSRGIDTVVSDVSWTLRKGFENLTLEDATSPPTPTGDLVGTGNGSNNIIDARLATGDHTLLGLSGNDHIFGGTGNDRLDGGAGADTLQGGLGDDSYIVDNAKDVVIENAGEGSDSLSVSANFLLDPNAEIENITLTGKSGQHFTADNSNNVITSDTTTKFIDGLGGDDTITGSARNDSIAGGDGNDTLTGNGGNDYLNGGAGDDIIHATGGTNVLTGGTGQDTFIFDMSSLSQHAVVIKDFNPNDTGALGGSTPVGDVLDLSDILSGVTASEPGEPLSDFLNIRNESGNSIVSIDLDGTGTAHHFQAIAVLQGITGLTGEEALVLSGNINAGTFGS